MPRRYDVIDGRIVPEQRDPTHAKRWLREYAEYVAGYGDPATTRGFRAVLVKRGWTDAHAAADVEELVSRLIGERVLIEIATDLFELRDESADYGDEIPRSGNEGNQGPNEWNTHR